MHIDSSTVGDAGFQKEIDFEKKLRELLAKCGYRLKDVINLLGPQAGRSPPAVESKVGSRKPRQLKVYKIPHAGEVLETKGGNHKTLKEWETQHGTATIDSWLTN